MPNGYIDRALSLRGLAHAYLSVNIWDLIRYNRRFQNRDIEKIILAALKFTHDSSIRSYWAEDDDKTHPLAFWTEAVYHQCLVDPSSSYRQWLAQSVLDLERAKLGLPPSLLGANAEAIPVREQVPCPSPIDKRLRVVNLSRGATSEILAVNPTSESIHLDWEENSPGHLAWVDAHGEDQPSSGDLLIPANSWIWGRTTE